MGISYIKRVLRISSALALAAAVVPDARAAVRETQTISAVDIHDEGGVTRISMRGAEQPIYTAFMREDPQRLIIELPDVTFEGVKSPIVVDNGLVSSVTLSEIGDPKLARSMVRISIGLERASEYEVVPGSGEVVVELRPAESTASTEEPFAAPAPPAPPLSEEPLLADTLAVEPATIPVAYVPGVAGKIVGVERIDNGIAVLADGPIDNVDSFVLRDPDRIVVDFWGVKSTAKPANQSFADGSIARVRIGTHADKVRVVLDMRDGGAEHTVVPSDRGVRIEIGDGPASGAGAPPASSEPAAAWTGVATISGARFESLAGADRIVVEMDHQVKANVVEPDGETLIVRILNATIDKSIERRVDTREFGGPIEMFSIFQTPDIKNEVRIILRRRDPRSAELIWEGSELVISVPQSGDRAAAPEGALDVDADTSVPGELDTSDPVLEGGEADALPLPPPAESDLLAGSPAPALAASDTAMDAYGGPLSEDALLFGPADPASIDILEEGGFDEQKAYEGRRISLDFKDADIGNILRLIAEVSDLNVIAGDEVDGKVTIRLVDVPWDQALDVILLTKGLGFVRVGSVLRIAPIETLKIEREARLQERRAKEKLEDLVVKLQPVNYADVKEVSKLIERILSPRGSVNVDQRTSTLIMKDIPSVIHEATALLKAIDTQTPQVLIEAKIVEASLNFSRSLGAVWGLGYRPNGSRGGGGDVHLGDGAVGDIINLPDGVQTNNFITSNPVAGALNGLLTLGLLGADEHLQLDLQLQAAEENRKGKVISSPRVVTLDNREAVIKQGVAIKFVEVTDDKITTSFVDAVLELKVTPHITANKSIIMKIKVSRNAPQLSAATGEVVGIDKNEATTEALVRDGETMVLGGIYVVENGHNRNKVPFLADIPLLGAAFRSSTIADERRELLIFVTPRIVLGPSQGL